MSSDVRTPRRATYGRAGKRPGRITPIRPAASTHSLTTAAAIEDGADDDQALSPTLERSGHPQPTRVPRKISPPFSPSLQEPSQRAGPSYRRRRPVTPPPREQNLSQDLATAFEVASPGSSQTLAEPLPLVSTSASPLQALPPSDHRKKGVAARMGRAKASNLVRQRSGGVHSNDAHLRDDGTSSQPLPDLAAFMADSQQPMDLGPETQPAFPTPSKSDVTHGSREGTPNSTASSPLKRKIGPLVGNSPRRTYGGGVRSFLQEIKAPALSNRNEGSSSRSSILAPRREDGPMEVSPSKETYAELRSKWVIEDEGSAAAGNPGDPSSTNANLKSLTRLRSAGSSKRFLDELNYLLAGLDPSHSPSARQSSSIALVRSMWGATDEEEDDSPDGSNLDFLHKIKATQSQSQVWLALREAGGAESDDEVLNSCLLLALARMTERRACGELLYQEQAQDIWKSMERMLHFASSRGASLPAAQEAKRKTSRSEMLIEVRRLRAIAWPGESSGSGTLITALLHTATGLLETYGAIPTSHDDDGQPLVAAAKSQALATAFAQLQIEATDATRSSRNDGPSLANLGLLARLAELHPEVLSPGSRKGSTLASDLVTVLQWLCQRLNSECSTDAARVTVAWLQVLVSATQSSEWWCQGLLGSMDALVGIICSHPQPSSGDQIGDGASSVTSSGLHFDASCLALALLTNLLEWDSAASARLAKANVAGSSLDSSTATTATPAAHFLYRHMQETSSRIKANEDADPRETLNVDIREGPSLSLGATSDVALQAATKADDDFVVGCLAVALALAIEGSAEIRTTLEEYDSSCVQRLAEILEDFAATSRTLINRIVNSSSSSSSSSNSNSASEDDVTQGEDLVERMARAMSRLYSSGGSDLHSRSAQV